MFIQGGGIIWIILNVGLGCWIICIIKNVYSGWGDTLDNFKCRFGMLDHLYN